jgi:RNA polymerase sigma factor (TIGR02999 family)
MSTFREFRAPQDEPMHGSGREVTRLLGDLTAGDSSAAGRLLPLVYEELHRLAGAYFAEERADHTLQPTALVHEAFLRLVNEPDSRWESRAHFYRVAAQAMRRVLVNHARDRARLKRGGGQPEGRGLPLQDFDAVAAEEPNYLALDAALERLGRLDPRKEQVVQLRYFGGFTIDDTARILDISPAQVKRDWTTARAFLLRELAEADR